MMKSFVNTKENVHTNPGERAKIIYCLAIERVHWGEGQRRNEKHKTLILLTRWSDSTIRFTKEKASINKERMQCS